MPQAGFSMMVELPLDAILTGALNASVGSPKPGSNGTIAYPITSGLPLLANGTASQIVNTTIASNTQVAFLPNCYRNGRCKTAPAALFLKFLKTESRRLPDSVWTDKAWRLCSYQHLKRTASLH